MVFTDFLMLDFLIETGVCWGGVTFFSSDSSDLKLKTT